MGCKPYFSYKKHQGPLNIKRLITNKAYHTTAQVANLILDNEEEDDNAEEFIIQESGKDPLASLEPDISIQVQHQLMICLSTPGLEHIHMNDLT